MPRLQSVTITLSEKESAILETLAKGSHTPGHLKQRATIILESANGCSNSEIARQLGIRRNPVKKWRHRYAKASAEIRTQETEHPREFRGFIASLLQDEARPGAPATFTNEQVAQIHVLSLQKPADHGVEGSHWTPSELARQAVKQEIVASISPRSVARFLKEGRHQAPRL
jgi:transposase